MTASETLQFIGNSLEVTYYDGTDYQTTTALYQTSFSSALAEVSESPVGFVSASGVPWLVYSFNPTRINTSPNYITVSLNPTYSIFDTEYLYTCVALSSGANTPSNTYTSPSCDWYIGGSVSHFENSSDSSSSSGRLAYLYDSRSGLNQIYDGRFTYVPILHSSASTFSAYCMSCDFNGNSYGRTLVYYFLVMCPYVSGDASGASGTFVTGGSSGSDINVSVDVDMSETNGILGRIENILGGLVDGVKGLFIPRQSFLEEWKDDMQDLLYDTFSPVSEAEDTLDDLLTRIQQVGEITTDGVVGCVEIPEIRVPHTGREPLVIPSRLVSLRPNELSGILEQVKSFIDILATIAVFNMLLDKFKAVLVGEKVVEVENAD